LLARVKQGQSLVQPCTTRHLYFVKGGHGMLHPGICISGDSCMTGSCLSSKGLC
jgi:hypothetical protein